MALVDYSSSEEEEEEQGKQEDKKEDATKPSTASTSLKRKRETEIGSATELPPLPSKFHDLYASTVRLSTKDDPTLHEGRKRVIPHIEGNWPTHLYIEWYPSPAESILLTAVISKLQAKARSDSNLEIHSSLASELDVPLPLHISLSRSLGFSAKGKGEFVDALERAIKSSGTRPFDVQFTGLDWVANFKKTRWFLVLRLQKPTGDGLNQLLRVCNAVAEDHGQPTLYKPPREPASIKANIEGPYAKSRRQSIHSESSECQDASDAFHFSIAWTLQDPNTELRQFTHTLKTEQLENIKGIRVKVTEVKAKVGNIVSSVTLPAVVILGKGLFGV